MNKLLEKRSFISGRSITLEGSKSESNRLLILQKLYPNLRISNLATADDTAILQQALCSTIPIINVGHAGTAMRFLTAYFAMQVGKEVILEGSERMHNRPIGELVNALRSLGAHITYLQNEGFPPLKIKGKALEGNQVNMPANVSSQFLSALLLIGGKLPKGLQINFTTACTSLPYLEMTASLLNQIGIKCKLTPTQAVVFPTESIAPQHIAVEADWSSASYLYSLIALSKMGSQLQLQTLYPTSKQGDAVVAQLFEQLGVQTTFNNGTCLLKRIKPRTKFFSYDFTHHPDLAQTIVVACTAMQIPCYLSGLHTLKIKETNRIKALQQELSALGAGVVTGNDFLKVTPSNLKSGVSIRTYNDHRMALSFAPLALLTNIEITDCEVVRKSYPRFWFDFEHLTQNEG